MNQTHSIVKRLTFFLLILAILLLIIYYRGTIGLADNSDFSRTLDVFSMRKVNPTKYLSFESSYIISNPKTIPVYFNDLFKPITDSPQSYYSTQFIFVKISLLLNAMYNYISHLPAQRYNIFFLAYQYIILYAFILTQIFTKKYYDSNFRNIIFKAMLIPFVFCSSYLTYFNSFYGETTSFIFLIIIVFLLIDFPQIKPSNIIFLLISIIIFSGSKTANYPSALLFMFLATIAIFKLEKIMPKIILTILLCLCLVCSTSYITKAPEWMEKVTTYHSVFYGALKNVDDKDSLAKELKIDDSLVSLHSTHGYMENEYDIYSESFESIFFDKVSKKDVLLFYLKNPRVFVTKLDKSAEASLPIKATYLSNYEFQNNQYLTDETKNIDTLTLIFEEKFDHYDRFRKSFTGRASIFISVLIIFYIISSILNYKSSKNLYSLIFRIILLCSTLGQFVVPIIGNGEADLAKHMFLFNIHLDILIVFILFDIITFKNKKSSAILIIFIALIFIHPYSSDQNIIIIGQYKNQPIEWILIDSNENGKTLLSKEILYYDAFDAMDNDYLSSSINKSLHENIIFDEHELELLSSSSNSVVFPYYMKDQSTKGNRPLFWFPAYKYAEENYQYAYQGTFNDYIFLPSVEDISKMSLETIISDDQYWLRTPNYSSEDLVRYVDKDGFIYHKNHNNILGIRPMITLK